MRGDETCDTASCELGASVLHPRRTIMQGCLFWPSPWSFQLRRDREWATRRSANRVTGDGSLGTWR